MQISNKIKVTNASEVINNSNYNESLERFKTQKKKIFIRINIHRCDKYPLLLHSLTDHGIFFATTPSEKNIFENYSQH